MYDKQYITTAKRLLSMQDAAIPIQSAKGDGMIHNIDIEFKGIVAVCINILIMIFTVWVCVAFLRYLMNW